MGKTFPIILKSIDNKDCIHIKTNWKEHKVTLPGLIKVSSGYLLIKSTSPKRKGICYNCNYSKIAMMTAPC